MSNFFRKLFFIGVLPFLAIGSGLAQADSVAPDVLVQEVTEDVLAIIRSDENIQQGDKQKLNELIEARVLPHFDFNRMTGLAVGRDWKNATPDQKAKLAKEFQTLLVRTYSNALITYRNQKIDYRPFRKPAPGTTEVTVRTQVRQPGAAQPIDLDYSLLQQGDTWKVFDVVVGGISLVTNYRDTFSQKIRSDGIDGLIAWLAEKNKTNQTV